MNNNKKIIFPLSLVLLCCVGGYGLYQAKNSKPPAASVSTSSNKLLNTQVAERDVFSKPELQTDAFVTKYPATESILNTNSVDQAKQLLSEFLSSLDKQGVIDAAYYFAQSDLDPIRYEIINLSVLEFWASLPDADAAAEALLFSQKEYPKQLKAKGVVTVLGAKCDSSNDIQLCVSQLPYSPSLESGIVSKAKKLAAQDNFPKAIGWVYSVHKEELRLSMLDSFANAWVEQSAVDAFNWSAQDERFQFIAKIAIRKVLIDDPWEAYNMVTAMADTHSDYRAQLYTEIIDSLIESGDFLTMVSILESASEHEVIAKVARKWVKVDPEAALRWAINYEDFYTFSLRAIDELTKQDYQKAFEITLSMPVDKRDLRADMFNSIFSDRAESDDYQTIMQLLEQLPANENSVDYYDNFIEQWAWNDPESAMNTVLDLPDSDRKNHFITDTLTKWGQLRPQAALKQANELSDANIKTSAIAGVIQGWAIKDSNELVAWLEKQPSSDDLDQSIVQANAYLLDEDQDPTSLISLANNISNEELRNSTLSRIQQFTNPEPESDF